MVKTSEDIIERQRDEKAMKLFSTYKPFLKNHLEGDENNLFQKKRDDRDFNKEKKKCSLNHEGLKKKKLPKNIDKIIEIEEERTFGSNFYKKEKGKNAFSNYNESLYERICQVFENDYIEPCSITWDMEYIKNPNQDIPYYRELAPYAREIINIK